MRQVGQGDVLGLGYRCSLGGVSLQGVLRVWGFGVSGRVGLMG